MSERFVRLARGNSGYGFMLVGHAPVYIQSIDAGGPAESAGLHIGDYITQINGTDVKHYDHKTLVSLIRKSPHALELTVVNDPSFHIAHNARSQPPSPQKTQELNPPSEVVGFPDMEFNVTYFGSSEAKRPRGSWNFHDVESIVAKLVSGSGLQLILKVSALQLVLLLPGIRSTLVTIPMSAVVFTAIDKHKNQDCFTIVSETQPRELQCHVFRDHAHQIVPMILTARSSFNLGGSPSQTRSLSVRGRQRVLTWANNNPSAMPLPDFLPPPQNEFSPQTSPQQSHQVPRRMSMNALGSRPSGTDIPIDHAFEQYLKEKRRESYLRHHPQAEPPNDQSDFRPRSSSSILKRRSTDLNGSIPENTEGQPMRNESGNASNNPVPIKKRSSTLDQMTLKKLVKRRSSGVVLPDQAPGTLKSSTLLPDNTVVTENISPFQGTRKSPSRRSLTAGTPPAPNAPLPDTPTNQISPVPQPPSTPHSFFSSERGSATQLNNGGSLKGKGTGVRRSHTATTSGIGDARNKVLNDRPSSEALDFDAPYNYGPSHNRSSVSSSDRENGRYVSETLSNDGGSRINLFLSREGSTDDLSSNVDVNPTFSSQGPNIDSNPHQHFSSAPLTTLVEVNSAEDPSLRTKESDSESVEGPRPRSVTLALSRRNVISRGKGYEKRLVVVSKLTNTQADSQPQPDHTAPPDTLQQKPSSTALPKTGSRQAIHVLQAPPARPTHLGARDSTDVLATKVVMPPSPVMVPRRVEIPSVSVQTKHWENRLSWNADQDAGRLNAMKKMGSSSTLASFTSDRQTPARVSLLPYIATIDDDSAFLNQAKEMPFVRKSSTLGASEQRDLEPLSQDATLLLRRGEGNQLFHELGVGYTSLPRVSNPSTDSSDLTRPFTLSQVFDGLSCLSELSHDNVAIFSSAIMDQNGGRLGALRFEYDCTMCEAPLQSVLHGVSPSIPSLNGADVNTLAPSSYKDVLMLSVSLACGLKYLHDHKVIHGFLSPYSVLVGPNHTIKISLFGVYPLVAYLPKDLSIARYQSPEVLVNPYAATSASDIYSMGVLLWELTSGLRAYTTNISTVDELFHHVVVRAKRPHIGARFPGGMEKVVKQCWEVDWTLRLDASNVVSVLLSLVDVVDEDSDDDEEDAALEAEIKRRITMQKVDDVLPSWSRSSKERKDSKTEALERTESQMERTESHMDRTESQMDRTESQCGSEIDRTESLYTTDSGNKAPEMDVSLSTKSEGSTTPSNNAHIQAIEEENDDDDFFAMLNKAKQKEVVKPIVKDKELTPEEAAITGPERWRLRFDFLIFEEAGYKLFVEFLKTIYCEENAYFWKDCEEYKKTSSSQLDEAGKKLYEKYLGLRAQFPLNIDGPAKKAINDNYNANTFPPTMYDQAQQQIYMLMKTDSYPRFVKSDTYKHYLERKSHANDHSKPAKKRGSKNSKERDKPPIEERGTSTKGKKASFLSSFLKRPGHNTTGKNPQGNSINNHGMSEGISETVEEGAQGLEHVYVQTLVDEIKEEALNDGRDRKSSSGSRGVKFDVKEDKKEVAADIQSTDKKKTKWGFLSIKGYSNEKDKDSTASTNDDSPKARRRGTSMIDSSSPKAKEKKPSLSDEMASGENPPTPLDSDAGSTATSPSQERRKKSHFLEKISHKRANTITSVHSDDPSLLTQQSTSPDGACSNQNGSPSNKGEGSTNGINTSNGSLNNLEVEETSPRTRRSSISNFLQRGRERLFSGSIPRSSTDNIFEVKSIKPSKLSSSLASPPQNTTRPSDVGSDQVAENPPPVSVNISVSEESSTDGVPHQQPQNTKATLKVLFRSLSGSLSDETLECEAGSTLSDVLAPWLRDSFGISHEKCNLNIKGEDNSPPVGWSSTVGSFTGSTSMCSFVLKSSTPITVFGLNNEEYCVDLAPVSQSLRKFLQPLYERLSLSTSDHLPFLLDPSSKKLTPLDFESSASKMYGRTIVLRAKGAPLHLDGVTVDVSQEEEDAELDDL